MTLAEIKLFNDIVDCADKQALAGASSPCCAIINAQSSLPVRQVPEPWNGNLSDASFLVLGSNPALDVDEVFPSKVPSTNNWSHPWTNQDAEDFFEGRFGVAICSVNRQPYVNTLLGTVLKYKNGSIAPIKMKNSYWDKYNQYCKAIDPSFQNWSFVVTDVVHCKSNKEQGVSSALPACLPFMTRIIDLFLNNKSADHRILIFGKESDTQKKLDALQRIGFKVIGTPTQVGNYNYKRKNQFTPHALLMQTYAYGGKNVDIYYNIPAPSGSNHAASPVTINGQTISW